MRLKASLHPKKHYFIETGHAPAHSRDGGGRRSSQVLCGPAWPILSEIYQPSALGATLKLSRWCRERRGISNE